MQSNELKIHVGCGQNYLPGWVNIDLFSSLNADIYADLLSLPFQRESVSCIYSSHTLEHVHRHMVLATLAHWRDLLKTGGILRLAVPDFAKCVEWYQKTGDLPSITGLLFGGQNHPKNNHFITFDEKTLTRSLTRVGFQEDAIRHWDWRKTEHAAFDDFASAYLPHLQKDTGMLMSLNLEAVK